jgi:hypothetical protein
MGNVSLEYPKICELKTLKHVRFGLEGELKFQGSDVHCIVLEEAPDNLESGRFTTLSSHFDHLDRCCGIVFTLHEAMAV